MGDWLTRLEDEAAFMQNGLHALKGGAVCVLNFGESAWVSTQGLIELFLQLKSGNSGAPRYNIGGIDHLYQDLLFLHYGDIADATSLINLFYCIQPDEIYHLTAQCHLGVSFDIRRTGGSDRSGGDGDLYGRRL